MTRLKHILRWLAVLPGAILAALIVMFPIHWAALYIHHFGPFSGPLITDEEGKGLLPLLLVGLISWAIAQAKSMGMHSVDTPFRMIIIFVLWLVSVGSALSYAHILEKGT